jgi:4,5-dihydroxyphthalate decarboxylase
MIDLLDVNALMVTLPWLISETMASQEIMGKDFWRYGVDESRHEIEALCQYLHEQGLTDRRVSVDELFVPATMDMSKV